MVSVKAGIVCDAVGIQSSECHECIFRSELDATAMLMILRLQLYQL